MNDKKNQLKHIFIRIYDKKLSDKYDEVKNTKRKDVSHNEFVQELIKLGLNVLSASQDEASSLLEASNEIKRMLGVIIRELRKESTEKDLTAKIHNQKMNAIYNLVVAQAIGESVTEQEIESGMYDTLPERFAEEYYEKTDGKINE